MIGVPNRVNRATALYAHTSVHARTSHLNYTGVVGDVPVSSRHLSLRSLMREPGVKGLTSTEARESVGPENANFCGDKGF